MNDILYLSLTAVLFGVANLLLLRLTAPRAGLRDRAGR